MPVYPWVQPGKMGGEIAPHCRRKAGRMCRVFEAIVKVTGSSGGS